MILLCKEKFKNQSATQKKEKSLEGSRTGMEKKDDEK